MISLIKTTVTKRIGIMVLALSFMFAAMMPATMAQSISVKNPRTKKDKAVVIGGGAAAGAVIGGLAGGKKGALIGALLGAGAGTGYVVYKDKKKRRY